jgi:hypothetical protein
MSEQEYLVFILPFLCTVLGVFAFKYGSAAYQARATAAREAAYRDLAQKALANQSATSDALAAMQAELAQISSRLASVVKILQDVE